LITEMYLCHACSCLDMLRAETAGQAERLRTARHEAFVGAEQTRYAVRRAAREARPRWHREAEQLAVHSHAVAIPGRAQRLRAELASLPLPPPPRTLVHPLGVWVGGGGGGGAGSDPGWGGCALRRRALRAGLGVSQVDEVAASAGSAEEARARLVEMIVEHVERAAAAPGQALTTAGGGGGGGGGGLGRYPELICLACDHDTLWTTGRVVEAAAEKASSSAGDSQSGAGAAAPLQIIAGRPPLYSPAAEVEAVVARLPPPPYSPHGVGAVVGADGATVVRLRRDALRIVREV
jgi:hypothetical protein